MILSDLSRNPEQAEIRQEAAGIPDNLPLSEVRRRLDFGANNLVLNPGAVVAAWTASLSGPSSGVAEA